jgi:hypothetical protein
MTEEEFELKVKPHIDGLFTGKYDLIVTPDDKELPPINYSTIIRTLVSAVNSLLENPSKKRKLE